MSGTNPAYFKITGRHWMNRSSIWGLSDAHHAYFMMSFDHDTGLSKPLNVGRAIGKEGLRQRMKQRYRDPERYLSPLEKQALSEGLELFFWGIPCPSKDEAKVVEAYLIKTLQPPGNRRLETMAS